MTKRKFNPDPASPVPVPPETRETPLGARYLRYALKRTHPLVTHALAYVAPAGRGIRPVGEGQVRELRRLVQELLHENDDVDERVRDFFVNARRLADSRGHHGLMDTAYCRRHRHLIPCTQPTRVDEDAIARASRARDASAQSILKAPDL